MRKKFFFLVSLFAFGLLWVHGQELKARVTVNASMVGSQVDKKIFRDLEAGLSELLNTRKWTKETFLASERIGCNFLITIRQSLADNVYKASLIVQGVRPVYNTMYQSTLMNFQDENFTFRYVTSQPIEFNENRVSGSDAYVSNLTATLAFYVYMILGLDFDSFALKGGDPYFQKAQQIVNAAPDARDIEGWKPFDSQRNRYWLAENFTNAKYSILHDASYNYYRLGMDHLMVDEDEARSAIMNAIQLMSNLHQSNGNTMAIPFFFQGKSQELVKIFKKASNDEKARAKELLVKIDISNSNIYKQELK